MNEELRKKIYTVTLADGTVIENLELNGNNFVSKTHIDSSIFEDNCSPVVISDGENEIVYENATLVQVTHEADLEQYWFIMRELTADEMFKIQIQSDIDYLAMMSNIEM